jgi:hypothetical protein
MSFDPIKQLQEDILSVMLAGRGYSSFEINDILEAAGQPSYVPRYHAGITHVQEALGYLLDSKRVYVSEQKYYRKCTPEEMQARFLQIKEAAIRKGHEEQMMKQHGRIISGYCYCCGRIRELDGTCRHHKECIVEPDGRTELVEA